MHFSALAWFGLRPCQALKTLGKSMVRWFRKTYSLDVRSLALFRIGLGCVLLIDTLTSLQNAQAFYSDDGILPRFFVQPYWWGSFYWSIHTLSGDLWFQYGLLGLQLLLCITFIIGFHTRLSSLLLWGLILSLQHRNPMVLYGGDSLTRILIMWAIFLPMAEVWSVDSLKKQKANATTSSTHNRFSTGVAAIQLQLVFIYFCTALLKSGDAWRVDYTAIQLALNIDYYTNPLGVYFRTLPPVFLKGLTFLTWHLEAFGPILFLIPWKRRLFASLGVLSFWGLHVGIMLTLAVGLFPWLNISAFAVFIPSGWFDVLMPLLQTIFSKNHWLISSCCQFIKVPLTLIGQTCSTLILAERRLFSPLANQKPLIDFIHQIKHRIAPPSEILCICLLSACMAVSNIDSLLGYTLNINQVPFMQILRTDQNWSMFAPSPFINTKWFVPIGQLKNGLLVNLITHKQYPTTQKEKMFELEGVYADIYPNYRWLTYYEKMARPETLTYTARWGLFDVNKYYTQYLCKHAVLTANNPVKFIWLYKKQKQHPEILIYAQPCKH